ncbi:MAG: MFS transporter [Candidatus Magasanikbacteria bacterium]|nr:MFS transporter [Candidatus Magasanikbacteria bacterium]
MEMVERLAYYGVKAVAVLYAKQPASEGGLGITMDVFGNIMLIWAFTQSFVPIFSGALSDRFGYKETIFASTVVKIVGYLIMAFFPNYMGFAAGAVVLALGTGIFKPGIQGTVVNATTRDNRSMAWGIFYQTVNIGGFIGPLVAGYMRNWDWAYVFYTCAGIISLNFLFLLMYKEPGKEERLAKERERREQGEERPNLFKDSWSELKKPHVWVFLGVFSLFWFMFNALFDVLPAHIDDWVDTKVIVSYFFGENGTKSGFWKFMLAMNEDGTVIKPEGLLNLNAAMIMTTCFLFAWLSGKLTQVGSMLFGTFLATISFFMFGTVTAAFAFVGVIAIFSLGEMFSSPKFNEFMGNIAPPEKRAMYLGFANLPFAIGWTIEGKLGPWLYGRFASKDELSRVRLEELGMDPAEIGKIPVGEAFKGLVDFTGQTGDALTAYLYAHNSVGLVWYIMGLVGILSMIGIFWYGKVVLKAARRRSA